MPNWDNLHGGDLIQYIFMYWMVWPLVTAILLVVVDNAVAKLIGLISLLCWIVFAAFRPVEFFFCFCFVPASLIGGLVRAFVGGVKG